MFCYFHIAMLLFVVCVFFRVGGLEFQSQLFHLFEQFLVAGIEFEGFFPLLECLLLVTHRQKNVAVMVVDVRRRSALVF